MIIKEFSNEEYLISSDPNKLQMDVIHKFLTNSYWAKGISLATVIKSVKNSYCFGVYKDNTQIGFARLITDYSTFAFLADVFIIEQHRGKGLSKWLMKIIMDFPELQGLRSWMLKTADAHGLYEQFGFGKPKFPERVMEYSGLKNGYTQK